MESLDSHRVLITGVGLQPVQRVHLDPFDGKPTHMPVLGPDGREWKANIGAAVAYETAKTGAVVSLVARSRDKLEIVQSWIQANVPNASVEVYSCDLADSNAIQKLAHDLPNDEKTLYWVQSVGLGAGTVQIPDNNPYVLVDAISPELIEAELSVVKSTIEVYKALLPIIRRQKETRVAIISSMSAVRSPAPGGIIHAAAKGAISRLANGLSLEEHANRVLVTDVRPGAIDTGLYDTDIVQKSIVPIGHRYGVDWEKEGVPLAPPSAVADAVVMALTSRAHVASINLLSRGQMPHEAS